MTHNLYITPESARFCVAASKTRRVGFLIRRLAVIHLCNRQLTRSYLTMFKLTPLAAALDPKNDKSPRLEFRCSPQDFSLINQIVARGLEMAQQFNVEIDATLATMDVCATHCNGRPMKLLQWLMSDASDFSHDFAGIGRHIDRKTGKLPDWFKLRFEETRQ